ncbi:MAG: glycosyltransferase [Bryobacteraceae bacterium]
MKVLHLVASLGSGGAERQLYLLCRETRGQVRHSVLAVREEGRWAEPLRDSGIGVQCLGMSPRNPLTVARIASLVRLAAPDLVHCWLPSMNVIGALASGPAPVIASIRNVDDWKPRLYRWLDRILSPLWTAVIANSYSGAEFAVRTGIPETRIRVVPNGIEMRDAAPRSSNPAAVAVTVCRLTPQKRVDRILETARRLPSFRFLIAGDGPQRKWLESAAPENVRFLGEVPDPWPLVSTAAYFLLASEREGMSNALLEALGAGCVPVVTPVGDNGRIVEDGISGIVAPHDRFAEAIVESLPRWGEMSRAARIRSERFTVAAMAEKTLEVYQDACSVPRLHQLDRARRRAA